MRRMADQKLSMPRVPTPSWANNDLMVDPGKDWNNTPVKVEPGAGLRDTGHLPEQNPTAQHLNQLRHEQGLWLQYQAALQPMSWFKSDTLPVNIGTNFGGAFTFNEELGAWLAAGGNDLIAFSFDGFIWSPNGQTGVAAQNWSFATSQPGGRSLLHSRTLGESVVTEVSGTVAAPVFTPQALPGTAPISVSHAVWDNTNALWLIAGVETGPAIVFWYDASPITGFTKVTPAALNSTLVIDIAHGVDSLGTVRNVAIGDGAAPNLDVWTSANGTAWTRATPTGITAGELARAIMWDTELDLFVMTTSKSVYTSVDGITWTRIRTIVNGSFEPRALENDGGALWLAGWDDGSQSRLLYSRDNGVTWRIASPPFVTVSTGYSIGHLAYSRFAGRFMGIYVDGASAGEPFVSLAVAETVQEVDGIVVPTVT